MLEIVHNNLVSEYNTCRLVNTLKPAQTLYKATFFAVWKKCEQLYKGNFSISYY